MFVTRLILELYRKPTIDRYCETFNHSHSIYLFVPLAVCERGDRQDTLKAGDEVVDAENDALPFDFAIRSNGEEQGPSGLIAVDSDK